MAPDIKCDTELINEGQNLKWTPTGLDEYLNIMNTFYSQINKLHAFLNEVKSTSVRWSKCGSLVVLNQKALDTIGELKSTFPERTSE